MKKTIKLLIVFTAFFIICCNLPAPMSAKTATEENSSIDQGKYYDVVIQEIPPEWNKPIIKTEIYLEDEDAGERTFYTAFTDGWTYHDGQYINGCLYIVRQTGRKREEYLNFDKEWTDELWKYEHNKKGKKLLSSKMPITSYQESLYEPGRIALLFETKKVVIFNEEGQVIDTYASSEVFDDQKLSYNLVGWGKHSLWLLSYYGWANHDLIKIDIDEHKVERYELPEASQREFSLNTSLEALAYSDFPIFIEGGDAANFRMSGRSVNLFVKYLKTGKREWVATSKAKYFSPKWLNNTLRYHNPDGEGYLYKEY